MNLPKTSQEEQEERKQQTLAAYDKIATQFSETRTENFWAPEFATYKTLIPGTDVLDVGCGSERDANMFTEAGFSYTGIDASPEMIKVCNERAKGGKFLVMDFGELQFPDSSFDGVWAAASLLHVPKAQVGGVLTELKRVLRPGGVGFISLKEKKDIDEGVVTETTYGGISRFFAFYTKDEFAKILTDEGFEILQIQEHPELKRPVNWLCYFFRAQKDSSL